MNARPSRATALLALMALVGLASPAAQERPLVWALAPNAPPTTYLDAAGRPTGFYVELFSRVMDELGIAYEFDVAPFAELYPRLVAGEADFFTMLVRNPERERYFAFPDKGASAGWSQLFIGHGSRLESILDLQHRTVGVVKDDRNGENFKDYAASLAIPCEIREYEGFEELIQAVVRGEAFAGVQSNLYVAVERRVQPTAVVFAPFKAYPVLSLKSGHGAAFEAVISRYDELVRDPESYYFELQAKWLGYERVETAVVPAWLAASAATLLAASLASAVAIRLLTAKLRLMNAELERKVAARSAMLIKAEKLSALGTLVGGLAHELNSPLQTLMFAAELPRKGPDDPEEEALRAAQAQALGRIDAVIKALRIYSHQDQKGEASVVSLPEQLDAALALFAGRMDGVALRAEYAALPAYRCYAEQLQQVWLALVSNALDAMGGRGNLAVLGRVEGDRVVVDVMDDGPGVDPLLGERVFEPFVSGKPEGSGSGLGLTVAKEIVATHRGTLSYDSRPGRTVFTVSLPAAGAERSHA